MTPRRGARGRRRASWRWADWPSGARRPAGANRRGAGPNRELLLRNIGPELARRGTDPSYLQAQRPLAEKTVAEFARQWMLQQRKGSDLPIQVTFSGPPPV